MQGMNRWWRREARRMERQRLRRIEEMQRRRAARRARILERAGAARAPRPTFRQWLLQPYKPADLLLLVLASWLLRGIAALAVGRTALPPAQAAAAVLVVQQAGTLAMVLAYLRWLAREEIGWLGPGGARGARPWLAPLAGIASGALLWLGERGAVLLGGRALPLAVPLPPVDEAAGPLALLAVLVGAPLSDELFYRRWLLRLFAHTQVPLRTAVVFSALLFGLAHPAPGGLILGTVGGIAYGALYARTRSTLAAVLMHGVHNALAWWL